MLQDEPELLEVVTGSGVDHSLFGTARRAMAPVEVAMHSIAHGAHAGLRAPRQR